MDTRSIIGQRHEAEDASWAFAVGPPHPELREDVLGYTGYVEHARTPLLRRELPTARVPVIISFGDTLDVVGGPGMESVPGPLTSFVAGLSDRYAMTRYVGSQRGLQVDLTPLGAFRLLGLTAEEIAAVSWDLADVLGHAADRLTDRLASAPDWAARFDLVDEFLLRRAERARPVDPVVAWSWQQVRRSGGRVPIGVLVAEAGWSRRHFIDRFRRQIGMGPKAAARVVRFARAARMLDGTRTIVDVAAECGYTDQSHLNRDVRAMAGCTPTELIVERTHF